MQIGPGNKPLKPDDDTDQPVDKDAENALDQSLVQVGSGLNRQIAETPPNVSMSFDEFPVLDQPEGSPVSSRAPSIADDADDSLGLPVPVFYVSRANQDQIGYILELFFEQHPDCLRASARKTLSTLDPILGPGTQIPQMRKFIKANPDNARAAMYYIAGLMASGLPEDKLWAKNLCMEVVHVQPGVVLDQTNCWVMMEAMSRFDTLPKREKKQTLQVICDLASRGYPMASWYMSLINLGCIENLPIGNPKLGLEQLLVNVSPLQDPKEQRKQGQLPYTEDPLTFSVLDRIPRHPSPEPEPELKAVFRQITEQDDPDFRYLFLPWLFVSIHTRHDLPASAEVYEEALGGDCAALEFVRECFPVHKRLIQYHRMLAKHKSQKHQEMTEAAARVNSRSSRQSRRLKKLHQDKLVQAIEDLKNSSTSFHPRYRSGDKQEASETLLKLDAKIQTAETAYFKALLHFHAGVLCQIKATDRFEPDIVAAGHYLEAGRIGDFVSLLHYCEDTYLNSQMYDKAADAVLIFSLYCASEKDDEWEEEYRLKAELYQNRAKELEEFSSRKTSEPPPLSSKDSSPVDIAISIPETKHHKSVTSSSEVDTDWIPTPTPSSGKSKKRHQQSKRAGKNSQSKKGASGTPTQKTRKKQPSTQTEAKPSPPVSTEPPKPEGATALSPDPDLTPVFSPKRKRTPNHCLQKLPEFWSRDVFRFLGRGLRERRRDNIEREGKELFDGLEQLRGQPGVERLHEEYAWHLMGVQHQPNLLLDSPETEAQGKYMPASKIILDSAEHHLKLALSIKLEQSVENLPDDPAIWQEIAEQYSTQFQNPDDRERYLNGISYIMRSIGHVRDRRASVVKRSGQQSTERHRQAAYAQKRVTQTRQPPTVI